MELWSSEYRKPYFKNIFFFWEQVHYKENDELYILTDLFSLAKWEMDYNTLLS